MTWLSLLMPAGFAVGFWPLPEAYWPDVTASSLPQRLAHPTLKFTCTNQEPMVIENLPFDKYELEPSPLTLFILGRKQPNYCWQVFIQGSTRTGEPGHPFGYLKVTDWSVGREGFMTFHVVRRAPTCLQSTCLFFLTTTPCCCLSWTTCSKFTDSNRPVSGGLSSTTTLEQCRHITQVRSISFT